MYGFQLSLITALTHLIEMVHLHILVGAGFQFSFPRFHALSVVWNLSLAWKIPACWLHFIDIRMQFCNECKMGNWAHTEYCHRFNIYESVLHIIAYEIVNCNKHAMHVALSV